MKEKIFDGTEFQQGFEKRIQLFNLDSL